MLIPKTMIKCQPGAEISQEGQAVVYRCGSKIFWKMDFSSTPELQDRWAWDHHLSPDRRWVVVNISVLLPGEETL